MVKRVRNYILKQVLNSLPRMAFMKVNRWLLRQLGHQVDATSIIWSSVKLLGEVKLHLGRNSFVGDQCTITGGSSTVEIGDYCDISSNVSFVTGSHHIDLQGERIAGEGYSSDIKVGNRVWIGFGTIVLGGVEIGSNVIVATGSVVNKSLSSNAIYGGVPAKLIRTL